MSHLRDDYKLKLQALKSIGFILPALVAAATAAPAAHAQDCASQDSINCEVSIIENASTGDFAPYYIGSLNHGKVTQKASSLADFKVTRAINPAQRLSYGFGAEFLAGVTSSADYMQWNDKTNTFDTNPQHPARIWIQQLYGEIKYRSLFLTLGLKERTSPLVNPSLSSGDLVQSGNARPMPEARAGFLDFVDIPLTNGWLQIQGELAYGAPKDKNYMINHYNFYNYHIAVGSTYTYRRAYFRTNPAKPLSVTFGMQSASFFGGDADFYASGVLTETRHYKRNLGTFFEMIIPVLGSGEDFVKGSNFGSWDFKARYRLRCGDEIAAYFQWPFEDGSGIARRNHPDGLWGLEYKSSAKRLVNGVVLEYIDFRDQSGPIHYAPSDYADPTLTSHISGRDNYYNNGYYNSYAYFGMSLGTPFMISPIYNLDGYPAFACTRVNGFHVGISGWAGSAVSYRLLGGYQRGMGTYEIPYPEVRTDTSVMAEAVYHTNFNLDVKAQLAFDTGSLRGDNFGALISVSYRIPNLQKKLRFE